LRLESIEFDPRVVVEEVAEMLAPRAHEKGLELGTLVHADVPDRVLGDPGRLRQILVNLAGNAVKFTERGDVTIEVSLDAGDHASPTPSLRFDVADTGIGIPEQKRTHLFEPFYQADASDARRYGGSGLGLAITSQLVELMGGHLTVTSQPEVGSTFSFVAGFGPAVAPAPPAERTGLAGLKVLVADHRPTTRRLLVDQLRSWGMDAEEAEDGAAALVHIERAASEGAPHALAIVRRDLAGMDGIALATAVRAEAALHRTRVVVVASAARAGDTDLAGRAGAAAYLTRPVRSFALYDCLVTTLYGPGTPGPDGSQAGRRAPAAPSHHVTSRGRVLVVEDNAVNQKVAVLILEKLGYRPDVAADGAEAVTAAIQAVPYDLILMDCQMPGMDGYEATSQIRRAEGPFRRTPIIAMTAGAMEGDRERCLAAGMDDYLPKPVRPEELRAALERWIADDTVLYRLDP
ncbi:MAG: response regulator, partial [Actinomycetota bacterium]